MNTTTDMLLAKLDDWQKHFLVARAWVVSHRAAIDATKDTSPYLANSHAPDIYLNCEQDKERACIVAKAFGGQWRREVEAGGRVDWFGASDGLRIRLMWAEPNRGESPDIVNLEKKPRLTESQAGR